MLAPEVKTMEALKITPETYEIYLMLPAATHLPLQKINNCYIVREKNAATTDWNWFDDKDFHKYFHWATPPSKTEFTSVITLPEVWE